MNNIKKLMLRTSMILLIGTCGCSLQKEPKSTIIETTTIDSTIQTKSNDLIVLNEELNTEYNFQEVCISPTPTPLSNIEPEEIKVEDNRLLVSLTFDDGPSAYTEELLKLLEEYNVKATFFVVGDNCEKYPTTLSLINEYGHELAIHGDSHTSFTKLTISEVEKEIETTINYIEDLGIDAKEIVRPPYGNLNSNLRNNIEYPFMLWNIDTEDWKTKDKEKIKKEITDNITEGAIILMHDTKAVHQVDLEALEELLPELTKEYKFVTISELVKNFNVELENGKSYRKIIKSEN